MAVTSTYTWWSLWIKHTHTHTHTKRRVFSVYHSLCKTDSYQHKHHDQILQRLFSSPFTFAKQGKFCHWFRTLTALEQRAVITTGCLLHRLKMRYTWFTANCLIKQWSSTRMMEYSDTSCQRCVLSAHADWLCASVCGFLHLSLRCQRHVNKTV